MNGVVGLALWLAFAGLLVWCAVATRRHDRKAELDVYADARAYVNRLWAEDWDSAEDAVYDREHDDMNRAW